MRILNRYIHLKSGWPLGLKTYIVTPCGGAMTYRQETMVLFRLLLTTRELASEDGYGALCPGPWSSRRTPRSPCNHASSERLWRPEKTPAPPEWLFPFAVSACWSGRRRSRSQRPWHDWRCSTRKTGSRWPRPLVQKVPVFVWNNRCSFVSPAINDKVVNPIIIVTTTIITEYNGKRWKQQKKKTTTNDVQFLPMYNTVTTEAHAQVPILCFIQPFDIIYYRDIII